MNANRYWWPAVLGVAVGITPAGFAEQEQTTAQPEQRQQRQTEQRQQGEQRLGQKEARQLQNAHAMIGTTVKNRQGEDLGNVEDIVLDRNHERVAYVVVSTGGLMGLGQKYFAVPIQAFKSDPTERQYILDVDARTLEEQPGFDRNNWPEQADPMMMPASMRQQEHREFQRAQERQQQQRSRVDSRQNERDLDERFSDDRYEDQRYQDRRSQDQRYDSRRDQDRRQDPRSQDQRYQERDQRYEPQGRQSDDYYRDFRRDARATDRTTDRRTDDRWNDDRWTSADERRTGQWDDQRRDTRDERETTRFGRGTDMSWGTGERPEGAPEHETFWMRRVTRLTGTNVINLQNKTLGQIEDLVIDVQDGTVAYATVSYGGVLGVGESQATVPWAALSLNAERNRVVLETNRETLEGLAFREATAIDDTYARDLHQQFEREPYWQTLGFENGRAEAAWGAESSYSRLFDPKKVQTIEGTIQSIGTYRPQPNASPGLRLRVTTEKGQNVIVQLGPERHMQQQKVNLRVGQKITVTGAPAEVQGRSVLLASEVKYQDQTIRLRDDQGRPQWQLNGQRQQMRQQDRQQEQRIQQRD